MPGDFTKPQAFHTSPIARSGGIATVLSLTIFFGIYYLLYSKILYSYILICYSMFLIGFVDDLKINIKPFKRLLLMIFLLFILIYLLPIKILNIDIPFLRSLMSYHLFSSIFVLICFLFIINGANLIDGFNGLLCINLLIINIILAVINAKNGHLEFSFFITAQIIVLLAFLLFNFPRAKMFLGDGGAYFTGSLIALNVIVTNNLNQNVSSFFFCILLFYLFFEVFFSFFRKILQSNSPIYPDHKHLHMLIFYKISAKYGKDRGNFLNSLLINLVYFVLIIPGLYFIESPSLSRYWFFILLIIYVTVYSRLYHLTKN